MHCPIIAILANTCAWSGALVNGCGIQCITNGLDGREKMARPNEELLHMLR